MRRNRSRIVVRDRRIVRHAADGDTRIDATHVRDDDAIVAAAFAHRRREARRAFRVTGMVVRRQRHAAERDRVLILEPAVDFHGVEARIAAVAEAKVADAAVLEQHAIGLRHHELRVRDPLELGEPGDVIAVRMCRRQYLHV